MVVYAANYQLIKKHTEAANSHTTRPSRVYAHLIHNSLHSLCAQLPARGGGAVYKSESAFTYGPYRDNQQPRDEAQA